MRSSPGCRGSAPGTSSPSAPRRSTPRFLQPLRAIAGWRSRVLDAEVRAAASAFGATYVDIAGRTRPGFDADPGSTHADDRFHPNDAGYELWADAVLDRLLPLLARG